MEIIYFLLLMIIMMLLVLIISIGQLNKNIAKLYFNLDDKLNILHNTIIDIHPNYNRYKKVYENKYEQNIKLH